MLQSLSAGCNDMQDRWMLYGGSYEFCPNQYINQLHVFDFTTMAWSKPSLKEDDMGYRYGHMATCYRDRMIVLGGRQTASLPCPFS